MCLLLGLHTAHKRPDVFNKFRWLEFYDILLICFCCCGASGFVCCNSCHTSLVEPLNCQGEL